MDTYKDITPNGRNLSPRASIEAVLASGRSAVSFYEDVMAQKESTERDRDRATSWDDVTAANDPRPETRSRYGPGAVI